MNHVVHIVTVCVLIFITDMTSVVEEILKQDMSINLYMFHGGTNFGFMNGALAVDLPVPLPMVTSYGRCSNDRCFMTGNKPNSPLFFETVTAGTGLQPCQSLSAHFVAMNNLPIKCKAM